MKGFRLSVLPLVVVVIFFTAAGAAYADGLKAPPMESKAFKEVGIEALLYLQDWDSSLIPSGGGKDLTKKLPPIEAGASYNYT
ncbi:MAG: hypothetical protein AB1815_05470 [Bacillota bacterium]